MEQLLPGLVNAGGLGVMAAAMFWLHSKTIDRFDSLQQRALDVFREEQKAQRDQHDRHIGAVVGRLDVLEDHVKDIRNHLGK